MNKKVVAVIIFVSLFGLMSFALADCPAGKVCIPNYLPGVNTFGDLLLKIAAGVGTIVGSLGAVMIVIAGFLFLTSAGSPEKISKAKTALLYAVIGILIGIMATIIVETIKGIIGA